MKKLIGIWILVACASAFAKFSKLGAGDFSVASPPALGSVEDQHDMATLLQLQAARTDAQCAEAESFPSASFKDLFKDRGVLSDSQYSHMKSLLRDVGKTAVKIAHTFKKQFRRLRPKDEDSRIKPCSEDSKSLLGDYSYPSSHATAGTALSCLLAFAYPSQAEKLSAFGQHIGDLRVIGGFHHPSDVVAGEKLGSDICQRLLQDQNFVRKLKAAADSSDLKL